MKQIKSKFLLLGLLLLISAILVACNDSNKENAESKPPTDNQETKVEVNEPLDDIQELNLVSSAEIPSMDSVMADDAVSFNYLNNVMEGLYRLNQENVAVPAMAEGEPEVSEDGLTYTFTLRDAKWSNGTPVTADDFVFAWRRAIDPETGSSYGPYMMAGLIKNAAAISAGDMTKEELGVEAVNEKTLKVTLERPVPYFLSLMAFGTFYPQNEAFFNEQGELFAGNSDSLIYNGPFVLTEWDGTGLSWALEKNETYWDVENVKLDKINVNVVKETATAVNLYQIGEKDRVGLSGEYALQYREDEELVKELKPTIFYLKLNQERDGKKTALSNVKIRKAIAMSFNKEDLVSVVLGNGSIPGDYLVPKGLTFDENQQDFRDINGDMSKHNPEEAAKLFAEGMAEEGLTELQLELLGNDGELANNMDAYLKAQMEKNLEGLTIKLFPVPFGVKLDKDAAQDYDIQSTGWAPDFQDPITFLELFVTGSPQNNMSYSNPELDKLIDQAKNELALEPEARWEALAKAEKIIMEEDFPIASMYQQGLMALQKPYVHGIISHPFTGDYSYKWAYISGKE